MVITHMKKTHLFVRIILGSVPLIAVAVIAIGFTYTTAQQVYRMSANDPQIQIAEDTAALLSSGSRITEVVPQGVVAIEKSLSPYVIIYNEMGQPVAGSGSLHGQAPVLPEGVLQAAKLQGESRLTWQPEANIRQAIVVVPYTSAGTSGFVMSGRSLVVTEERIADLGFIASVALVISLLAILVVVALREWLIR